MSDTKVCTKCGEERPFSEFYKEKSGRFALRASCKPCDAKRAVAFYWKNPEKGRRVARERQRRYKKEGKLVRDWIRDRYTGIPCMDCDAEFPFCAMDFHHRPGESKLFAVASNGSTVQSAGVIFRLKEEIAKCDLVCACCHRVRTRDGT